jgi:predicted DNA-binding transcriptional regulator AlpA
MNENRETVFVNISLADLKNMIGEAVQEKLQQFKKLTGLGTPTKIEDEYLSASQVMKLFRINSRTTLWMWERQGLIPRSVKLPGQRRCLWRKHDLDAELNPPIKGQWATSRQS